MATIRFTDKASTSSLSIDDIFILTQNATDEDKKVLAAVLAEFVRQYSGDGTYLKPFRIGDVRIWYDATVGVVRIKYGSDPSTEQDGAFFQEAGGPGLE